MRWGGSDNVHYTYVYIGAVETHTPENKGGNPSRQVKPELQVPPRPHGWTAL